jgi:hypothetical protein
MVQLQIRGLPSNLSSAPMIEYTSESFWTSKTTLYSHSCNTNLDKDITTYMLIQLKVLTTLFRRHSAYFLSMIYQPDAFCCTTMLCFPFDRVVFHFSGLYYNLLCVFLILVCYFFTARRPPNGLLPWQKTRRYQLPWITSWWWRVIQDQCTRTRWTCIMNVEREMVKRIIRWRPSARSALYYVTFSCRCCGLQDVTAALGLLFLLFCPWSLFFGCNSVHDL